MLQWALLNSTDLSKQTVVFDNMKAVFTEIAKNVYEVILEVSSHKFLIRLEGEMWKVDGFEIVSTKGFMEVTNKSVSTLKNVVEHLWYRMD